MNYKNIITNEIISVTCYQKLSDSKQRDYVQAIENITHTVHTYQNDFMLYVLPTSTNYAMLGGLTDSCGGACEDF
jgi:hypothetical protein